MPVKLQAKIICICYLRATLHAILALYNFTGDVMSIEWKNPIPLEKELQSEEYPISHLPGIIRNAVTSYCQARNKSAPLSI